jgi:biopolymer transport protein ExbD
MAGGSTAAITTTPKKKARLEIIPLIDVVFFLLATFVLFTLSLNKSNSIPVKLPAAFSGDPHNNVQSVTISVTSDGAIAWDKDPITLDEFTHRLQEFHLQHPGNDDAEILINGDENAMFSTAVYVFDEARRAGVAKVYIETTSKAAGSE